MQVGVNQVSRWNKIEAELRSAGCSSGFIDYARCRFATAEKKRDDQYLSSIENQIRVHAWEKNKLPSISEEEPALLPNEQRLIDNYNDWRSEATRVLIAHNLPKEGYLMAETVAGMEEIKFYVLRDGPPNTREAHQRLVSIARQKAQELRREREKKEQEICREEEGRREIQEWNKQYKRTRILGFISIFISFFTTLIVGNILIKLSKHSDRETQRNLALLIGIGFLVMFPFGIMFLSYKIRVLLQALLGWDRDKY